MTVPDGPTDPQLSATPVEEITTIIQQPGYGPPAWAPPPSEPTLDRPAPGGQPAGQEVADRPPSGRVYGAGEGRAPVAAASGSGRGRTTIADEVAERIIGRIVTMAVEAADGVRGLHATEGEPVSVRLTDDHVEVDISVQVEFGHAVHEVAERLRGRVVEQVEHQLGVTAEAVNVLVTDVAFDVAESLGAAGSAGSAESPDSVDSPD